MTYKVESPGSAGASVYPLLGLLKAVYCGIKEFNQSSSMATEKNTDRARTKVLPPAGYPESVRSDTPYSGGIPVDLRFTNVRDERNCYTDPDGNIFHVHIETSGHVHVTFAH